jgi:cytosine/adenosine deaminase-related metal-dependent hydrolase
MILRARVVVTMDGPPTDNGAVAISGNRIVDVGRFDEVKAHRSGEVVDLGEQTLLPGLINAHCHLDYTCLRGKIPPQKTFTDWIHAINAAKASLSAENYVASIDEGFAEARRFGTTTIANLTAFPEIIGRIQSPIRTWWFAELIDVRHPQRANEIIELALQSLKSAENWGFAPHALFTASANLYRRCGEIARRENVLLTTHLAESREEMSMFRDAAGRLYEFMKAIGRPMDDCGHETPLETFVGRLGEASLPDNWIVAHLNELAESDFDLLERSMRRFHVVHCPRSHRHFGHSPFQFERLRTLGFNICLGTDSLASNDDLSLFAEMRAFQKEFPAIPAEEIFEMVTVNPARALRQESQLGKICANHLADLIGIPASSTLKNIFEEIIAFDRRVNWLMVDGKG